MNSLWLHRVDFRIFSTATPLLPGTQSKVVGVYTRESEEFIAAPQDFCTVWLRGVERIIRVDQVPLGLQVASTFAASPAPIPQHTGATGRTRFTP